MEYYKMLSDQFCQAAVLALRDLAIEFETANHMLYEYPPKNERVDPYGYFMYSMHNLRFMSIISSESKKQTKALRLCLQKKS